MRRTPLLRPVRTYAVVQHLSWRRSNTASARSRKIPPDNPYYSALVLRLSGLRGSWLSVLAPLFQVSRLTTRAYRCVF